MSKHTEKAVSKKPKAYKFTEPVPSIVSDVMADHTYGIVQASRQGVGSLQFFQLADFAGLNRDWLATEVLGLSLKTLQRYQEEGKILSPRDSEAVLKLFKLYQKGIVVFGNRDGFNAWLQKPAFGIGGQVPLGFLSMSTGIDLVMDELARIEFGATA